MFGFVAVFTTPEPSLACLFPGLWPEWQVTNSPSENLGNLQPCSFRGVSDSSLGLAPLLALSQADLTLSFNPLM